MIDDPIAPALKMAIDLFANGGRNSGRTLRMIERLKDGDVVVVPFADVGRFIENMARERRGISIRSIVVERADQGALLHTVTNIRPGARVEFDHTWVERFYRNALARNADDLRRLSESLNQPVEEKRPQPFDFSKLPRPSR